MPLLLHPALGYYLWPPRWIGAIPDGAHQWPEQPAGGKFGDLIYWTPLPHGLRCRAYRDGLLSYDIGSPPSDMNSVTSEPIRERIQIINAHLACLKASLADNWYIAAATGETVIGVNPKTGELQGPIGELGPMIAALGEVRSPRLPIVDWRILRFGPVISEEHIRHSFRLLRSLLKLKEPRRVDALLHAELLVRAQAALSVQDNAGALTYAWTAAEGMLRSMYMELTCGPPTLEAMTEPSETQQTQPKGIDPKTGKPYKPVEIPIPTEGDVMDLFEKVAHAPDPKAKDARRPD